MYADEDDNARELKRDRVMQDAIASGKVSLLGLVSYEFTAHKDIYMSFLQKYDKLSSENGDATSIGGGTVAGAQQEQQQVPTENTPLNTNTNTKISRTMSSVLSDSHAVSNSKSDVLCFKALTRLERVLKPFFIKYDLNSSGDLDMNQLGTCVVCCVYSVLCV